MWHLLTIRAPPAKPVPKSAIWGHLVGGEAPPPAKPFWTAFYLAEGSDEGLGSQKGITPPKMKNGKETVKFSMLYQRLTKVTLVPGKETTPQPHLEFRPPGSLPWIPQMEFCASKQTEPQNKDCEMAF